jgi:aminopeptidase N
MGKMVTHLYDSFHPERYDLEIAPDREKMTFGGIVTISGQKVGRPTKRLTFHQSGLKITEASIVHNDKRGDAPIAVSRINNQEKFDEVRLHTDGLIHGGKYTVTLKFKGKITRPMNGIYPCFFEEDGKQQSLIATQFESHHAREAFPCIDEPQAKAVFKLSLISPNGEAAVSNTPAIKETLKGSLKTTTFAPTPRMSTYLLAWVFGNMRYKEATTKKGVVIRSYATPENVQFTDFALDVAVKCMEFYEEYFGIDYPLEKCDFIALPDFASGAMENWGCITFREQTLLVDPNNTSLTLKQYVAMVVAHELTHMWFGNLVTMRWWTDLWLNEGFATWMEHLAVDKLFPEWQMWTQFAVDETGPALNLDALANTHPIEVPINHPDEISAVFDTISYNKGGSIINMLHKYLGPESFRDGLHQYLKTHAYSNTDTIDLWKALETKTKLPVESFMHAWTAQPGFPLIHAEVGQDALLLRQERFYLNPNADKDENETWPVPLLAGDDMIQLLDRQHTSFPLNGKKFLKLNIGKTGFYRVVYDANHTVSLSNAIAKGELEPLDRLGILSDALETSKAGYQSVTNALSLLSSFDREDNSAVWEVMAETIGSVRKNMDNEEIRKNIKPYVRKLVAIQLKRLGWAEKENDSHFDKLLRPMILGLAAAADEPSVVNEIKNQFANMTTGEDIKPDFRGVIYTTIARLGGEKEFDRLLELHNQSKSSEEKVILAAALCGFKQKPLIERALDLITSDTVRLQDAGYWVAYSLSNRYARVDAWQWVQKNWKWLSDNLGKDLSFYRFPMYVARSFTDKKFLEEYTAFFKKVSKPALERAIKQGIETIEWQSAWRERDQAAVKKFFKP